MHRFVATLLLALSIFTSDAAFLVAASATCDAITTARLGRVGAEVLGYIVAIGLMVWRLRRLQAFVERAEFVRRFAPPSPPPPTNALVPVSELAASQVRPLTTMTAYSVLFAFLTTVAAYSPHVLSLVVRTPAHHALTTVMALVVVGNAGLAAYATAVAQGRRFPSFRQRQQPRQRRAGRVQPSLPPPVPPRRRRRPAPPPDPVPTVPPNEDAAAGLSSDSSSGETIILTTPARSRIFLPAARVLPSSSSSSSSDDDDAIGEMPGNTV